MHAMRRPRPIDRSIRNAAVFVITLVAASMFGATEERLGSWGNGFAHQVGGQMSALWLLVPFLAGVTQARRTSAMTIAVVASWVSLLAYVAMNLSPVAGVHWSSRPVGLYGTWNEVSMAMVSAALLSQWPWFVGATLLGPFLGWLGWRWRTEWRWLLALPVALMIAVEPAGRWLASSIGVNDVPWFPFSWPSTSGGQAAEISEALTGLSLVVIVFVIHSRKRRVH